MPRSLIGFYGMYFGLWQLAAGLSFLALRKTRGWCRLAWWAGCLTLVVAAGLFIVRSSEPEEWFSDFNKAYYPAGQLVLENPHDLYAPPGIGFVNLPILALGFTTISSLSLEQAQIVFALLGIAAIGLSCWLLRPLTEATGRRGTALVMVLLLNGPLYYSFKEGNLTHFVLLLLVAAACCVGQRRDVWLGVLLALAGSIKLPLFLLVVYYGLRGRWRVIAGTATALVAINGTSLALFGFSTHQLWFDDCIRPFLGKPVSAHNIQSLSGFLVRLLTDRGLGDWSPLEVGWEFKALHNALVGLLLAITALTFYRAGRPSTESAEHTEFCAVLCLALIISPISWTHYYLLLLLPVGLYIGGRLTVPPTAPWIALVAVAVLMLSPPVGAPYPFSLERLLVSHYLFGGVLLLGVLIAARWRDARSRAFTHVDPNDHPVTGSGNLPRPKQCPKEAA